MISPKKFCEILKDNKIDFFTGVPDSLLNDFIGYLVESIESDKHIISANEGGAVALATGYHLATGKVACVYMQNSGLGNSLNPLVSLADREVYSIPMLLIVGWRGEPGFKDEPQHIKQGKITEELLSIMSVNHIILSPDMTAEEISLEISKLIDKSKKENSPCALIVRNGLFESYNQIKKNKPTPDLLSREEAIKIIVDSLDGNEVIISTTGKISRELYEVKKNKGVSSENVFFTVGSMGHASQIALGIAHNKKNKQVYCLDGDGAFIMHMGSLATIGWISPYNFKHILLNNMAHESVGGHSTAGEVIDMPGIAKSSNYSFIASVNTKEGLIESLGTLKSVRGPAFLEVKVKLGSRKDLGRPTETPVENKKKFMDFIGR